MKQSGVGYFYLRHGLGTQVQVKAGVLSYVREEPANVMICVFSIS